MKRCFTARPPVLLVGAATRCYGSVAWGIARPRVVVAALLSRPIFLTRPFPPRALSSPSPAPSSSASRSGAAPLAPSLARAACRRRAVSPSRGRALSPARSACSRRAASPCHGRGLPASAQPPPPATCSSPPWLLRSPPSLQLSTRAWPREASPQARAPLQMCSVGASQRVHVPHATVDHSCSGQRTLGVGPLQHLVVQSVLPPLRIVRRVSQSVRRDDHFHG